MSLRAVEQQKGPEFYDFKLPAIHGESGSLDR